MAGFTIQKGGFTEVTDLFLSICTDMVANGFTLKFPASLPVAGVGVPTTLFKATLEFAETEPTAATMPWRIQMDASVAHIGSINVATPLQLPNDGTTAMIIPTSGTPVPVGMVNTKGTIPTGSTGLDPYYFVWRDASKTTTAGANAYPMSYRVTVTDRGVAICVWEDASDGELIPTMSWLVVQRPVNHLTGAMLVAGHAPVYAVFSMFGDISKFVVRENDIFKPTLAVPADSNTEDSRAIINSSNQVAITEANRYVITFPNGLNTPRYAYTEELDMLAYTSADVVSEYTNVPLTVYGEGTARIYKAMRASAENSTGMRLLFLTNGGGAAPVV